MFIYMYMFITASKGLPLAHIQISIGFYAKILYMVFTASKDLPLAHILTHLIFS